MVTDGGAPRCRGCQRPLQFGTDRQGRTTESCSCGYQGYLETRPGQVDLRRDAPGGGRAAGESTAAHPSAAETHLTTWGDDGAANAANPE